MRAGSPRATCSRAVPHEEQGSAAALAGERWGGLSNRARAPRVLARPACYTDRMRTEAEIHERLTKLRGDLALLQEERRQLEQQIETPEWARRIPSLETQLAIVRRLIYTLEWVLNEHD